MKKSKQSNWLELLSDALASDTRAPEGDGWFTAKDLSTQHEISIYSIRRRITILLRQGRVEKFKGTQDGNNMTWYREVKGAPKKLFKA